MTAKKKKHGLRKQWPFYVMMAPGLLYLLVNNYGPISGLFIAFKTGKTVTFMVLQIPIMWQDTDGNGRRKLMNRSGSVRTVLSGWKSRQEKSR